MLTVVIKDAAPHADPPLELLLDTTFRPDSSPHGVLFGRRSDSLSLADREAIADFRLRSPHTEMITAPLQLRTYKWISADDLRRRKPLPLPLIDVRVTITAHDAWHITHKDVVWVS